MIISDALVWTIITSYVWCVFVALFCHVFVRCVCRHTYTAGQNRQWQVCCEHHHPWQCKPPQIQSKKCLPSGLQEPPPAQEQKALSAAEETTYVCPQDHEQAFDLI